MIENKKNYGFASDTEDFNVLKYYKIFKRYRFQIVGIVLTSIVLGLILALVIRPVFESQITIQVGQVGQVKKEMQGEQQSIPIENLPVLIARLHQQYQVKDRNVKKLLPKIESVQGYDSKNPILLLITAQAHTPNECVSLLQKEANKLIQEHHKLFTHIISIEQNERSRLLAQINQLKENIASLKKKLYSYSVLNEVSFMVHLDINRQFSELISSQDKLAEIDRKLSPLYTFETRIISGATLPTSPVKPRKLPMVLIAGLLGFTFSIFLVFILHNIFLHNSDEVIN